MAHQATMTGGNGPANSPKAALHNVTNLAHDIALLIELQAKLAAVDFRDAAAKGVRCCVVIAAGAAFLLAALPILLMGIAHLLIHAGLPAWAAFLLTGVCTAILASIVAAIGAVRLRRSFDAFRRSREEFSRNLDWIKTVLVQRGEAVAPRA